MQNTHNLNQPPFDIHRLYLLPCFHYYIVQLYFKRLNEMRFAVLALQMELGWRVVGIFYTNNKLIITYEEFSVSFRRLRKLNDE